MNDKKDLLKAELPEMLLNFGFVETMYIEHYFLLML